MEVEYGINVKNKFDLLLDDDNDPEETVAEAAARAIIDVENREKEAVKAAKKAKEDAAIAAKPAAQQQVTGKENRPDGAGGGRGAGRGGRGGRGGNFAAGRGGGFHQPRVGFQAGEGEDGATGEFDSPARGGGGARGRGGYRGAFRGARGGREFRRGGMMGGAGENVDNSTTHTNYDESTPVAEQNGGAGWGNFGDGGERPPRFEGRGGRGGGYNRGPRADAGFPARRGRTDRISGSDKTGVKPVEKRHGSGRGNWGTQEDELTGETEALGDKTEKAAAADGAEKNADKPAPPPMAPEEKTLTLEEWKRLQTKDAPQFNVRKPAEPKGKVMHTKLDDSHADEETGVIVEKRAPKKQTIALDFKVAPSANAAAAADGGGFRGGYRGGRGGGRGGFEAGGGGGAPRMDRPDFRGGGGRGGRGGRGGMEFVNTRGGGGGGQRGASSSSAYAGTALKLDECEFPALG